MTPLFQKIGLCFRANSVRPSCLNIVYAPETLKMMVILAGDSNSSVRYMQ